MKYDVNEVLSCLRFAHPETKRDLSTASRMFTLSTPLVVGLFHLRLFSESLCCLKTAMTLGMLLRMPESEWSSRQIKS